MGSRRGALVSLGSREYTSPVRTCTKVWTRCKGVINVDSVLVLLRSELREGASYMVLSFH